MRRLVIRAMISAAALMTSVYGSLAQTPVKMVLDFAIQGQQSPLVLAADGGFFAREGLSVQVDRGYGSADAISKVASGAYDVAFADLGAAIQFNGRQGSSKLVSVLQIYDVAPMVMLSLKKSNITQPSQLAGKRIASPPAASSRVMFPAFAAANKIDTTDIKWLDVTPQLRETLLMQGQADATTAFITDLAGLKHLNIPETDVNVMRFSDYGVDLYGHAILTTPEFIAKNPEVVRKLVKGIVEAMKASVADPSKAIGAIKKRDPLVDEAVERSRLDLVIKNAILTDNVKKLGLGTVNDDRMKKTIATVTSAFKTPAVDVKSIYNADFLPTAADRRLQ
jgi:NitT/TauT family transport system substrate-binding protein